MGHTRGPGLSLALAALALLVGLAGCDTDQPARNPVGGFAISLSTAPLTMPLWDCYDEYGDENNNNMRDPDEELFILCEDAGMNTTVQVPWQYRIQVQRIPEGQTEAVALTSGRASFNPDANLTLDYDMTDDYGGSPAHPPFFVSNPPPGFFFRYENARRRSGAHPEVVECLREGVIVEVFPGDTCETDLCISCAAADLGDDPLGDPRLDDLPVPFNLALEPGDTVLVRAERQSMTTGVRPELAGGGTDLPELQFSATLNGVDITADFQDELDLAGLPPSDGERMAFFFTLR